MEAKITNNDNFVELRSEDVNGEFSFKILKGGMPQLQLSTQGGDEECYVNMSINELKALRESIDIVIQSR